MNCKPGDLARVITRGPFQDRIIRVTETTYCQGFVGWLYEGPPLLWRGKEQKAFFDHVLRPIRNPGEDAQDETLSWKPVPQGEEVPA